MILYTKTGKKKYKLSHEYDPLERQYKTTLRDYRVDTTQGGIQHMPLSFRLKTYLNNKIKSEYIYDTEGDTISLKSYEYDIISPRFVINEEYFLAHPYNHSMKNPMNPAVRQIRRSEYFHLSNGIYDYKKEYVNGLLTKIILYRYTYHPVNGKDLLKTTQ